MSETKTRFIIRQNTPCLLGGVELCSRVDENAALEAFEQLRKLFPDNTLELVQEVTTVETFYIKGN